MIHAEQLEVSYGDATIIDGLDIRIPEGEFTVIIGPNGSGKSTLLGALSRSIPARAGRITVDGRPVHSYGAKELARKIGFLPQSPLAPEGIRVGELVARGRYPHRSLLGAWSPNDEAAVAEALERTGLTGLSDRFVDELSGGQRQRVWIALVLTQQTPLLLLDEPTAALDLAHQIDVLRLCHEFYQRGTTIVAVLHDLNQAFRYASNLVVMKEGRLVAHGEPRSVVTAELVEDVFGVRCDVAQDPQSLTPMVVPHWP